MMQLAPLRRQDVAAAGGEEAGASTTTLSFDCLQGFLHWESAWSPERKRWCCRHRSIGCEAGQDDSSSDEFGQKAESTVHELVIGSEYDCETDLEDWSERWSSNRQEWCCLHQHLGCHDCTGDPVTWAVDKQEWCCKSKFKGCEAHLANGAVGLTLKQDGTTRQWSRAWQIAAFAGIPGLSLILVGILTWIRNRDSGGDLLPEEVDTLVGRRDVLPLEARENSRAGEWRAAARGPADTPLVRILASNSPRSSSRADRFSSRR